MKKRDSKKSSSQAIKLVLYTLLIGGIQFYLIWKWIQILNPDSSMAIGLIVAIPTVLFGNLILAGILYFFHKNIALTFLICAFISSVFTFVKFSSAIEYNIQENYSEWHFFRGDTTFSISLAKFENLYGISYNLDPGSSIGIHYGNWETKNDTIYMYDESLTLFLYKDSLFNFRNLNKPIKLTRGY